MDVFDLVYGWLAALPAVGVYVAVFVVGYLENVVPPVPGDVALVVGGMIAAASAGVALPAVIALATLAGGLGFMTVYAVGRRAGVALLDPDRYRWLPKRDIERARVAIGNRGQAVVLANRFLPGLRAVIGLAVGMTRLPAPRVAVLATASSAVWSSLVVGMGFAFVDRREVILRVLGTFERVGIVLLAALGAAAAVWVVRARRRRREGREEPAKTPPGPGRDDSAR